MLECQTGDDPATTAWKAVMLPTYTTGTWNGDLSLFAVRKHYLVAGVGGL